MANCPKCGASVREGKAFCPECGEPLGATRAARAGEQPPEFRETVVVPPTARGATPPLTQQPRRAATGEAQGAREVGEQRPGFFGRGTWIVLGVILLLIVLAFLAVAFFAR
ncbi:MAG: zinc ribbon domain-containing protein [Pyrinomonadaceae bacterium]